MYYMKPVKELQFIHLVNILQILGAIHTGFWKMHICWLFLWHLWRKSLKSVCNHGAQLARHPDHPSSQLETKTEERTKKLFLSQINTFLNRKKMGSMHSHYLKLALAFIMLTCMNIHAWYSGSNNYLIPCWFCRFAHLQRMELCIILIIGTF